MSYLVVQHFIDPHGVSDVATMAPCRDLAQVTVAILRARMADHEWAVFELTPAGVRRRSVVFAPDGATVTAIT